MDSFVVVGTGVAGVSAAAGMRTAGFTGRITLIGDEPELPYRRPAVSKELLRGDKTTDLVRIKPGTWFDEQDIEVVTGVRVTSVDPQAHVVLAGSREWRYDRLVLATGGRARTLPVASSRVHTVRSAADAARLQPLLRAAGTVVIVGAGLVGSEIAAGARSMGCAVTLLESASRPLARLLPEALADMYAGLHKAGGTELCTDVDVTAVVDDGAQTVVTAADGRSWSAPVVVVAIGMVPNTELAGDAGAEISDGIVVDGFGRTSIADLYAAGDVANRPEPIRGGRCRIEHWQGAQNHATAVGRAVAGDAAEFAEVPWCWSDQYGHNLQVTGWPEASDEVIVRGSLDDLDFIAYLLAGGELVGAVSVGRAADVRAARKLIAERGPADRDALAG